MTFEELRLMASGFQPAKLLLTALEKGLFDLLDDGPKTAREIADALGTDKRATNIVANALAALGLLTKEGVKYANSEVAAYLVSTSPEYKGAILKHIHACWEDWATLGEGWANGGKVPDRKEKNLPRDEDDVRNFILGMENVTREIAPVIANLLPLEGCSKVLDVGAGPGNYVLSFVNRVQGLEAIHFDLPSTSNIAREYIKRKPGADRISFLEGDFLADDLGSNYDLVWMSQIIHMLSDADAKRLVSKCAKTLASGGALAIHDQFLDPDMASPVPAAMFSVHMLVATGSGRSYSLQEVEGWMKELGLTVEPHIQPPGQTRIALARKS